MTLNRTTIFVFVAALLSGCAGQQLVGDDTVRVDRVEPSGFLSDYSILKPGDEGQAALLYWNDAVDFSVYDSVMVDPVTVWLGNESPMKDVSPEERQKLADEFHSSIVAALQPTFRITNQSGPRTMRIRVALIDAQESAPVMDTISTYIPQARLVQSVLSLGSDTAGFVGEASAEAEVLDAQSNVLLAAGVDRRAGTKALSGGTFSAWGDVRRAFDAWSGQFVRNLDFQRQQNQSGTGGAPD